ncbi:MAG TPA: F0F1 ATP synthase subunit alpha, partial [Candidatus Kapabacteria bacterium]|nr:F0F1 ATP synthase subunit alpha [Candidatus Kapabacteria bacterium]
QQLLRRGQRLVELLKQGQYQPMPVEEQVVSIFAGTNGFIDAIPVEQVRRFETGLLEAMRLRHADLLAAIADKKELTAEITEQLKKVIGEYAASFKA